jgi:hypothetical protein
VRPSGFEPETCGLRVRVRGVQGAVPDAMNWGDVSARYPLNKVYRAQVSLR